MVKLEQNRRLGRALRQDDPEDVGRPTPEALCDAVDAGESEAAKALARYFITESKYLHDWFCDLIYNLLTEIANRHGEEEMYAMLRASSETWMMRRTWKAFQSLSVAERVYVTAEIMRAHQCGPGQNGQIDIREDEEKFTLVMDPCGSGGRMRRGDPVDGSPSRLSDRYGFGATQEAHPWSWGRKGVPYYCIHCAVNELLPMEWGGHPLWVTDYEDDAHLPCRWRFYKQADDIPETYYTRLGREKPPPGEGTY